MKKLAFIPLLALLFVACSKESSVTENPTQIQTEKHALRVSVADFIQEHSNMRRAGNAAGKLADVANISDIYYTVYDQQGVRVNTIHQDTVNNSGSFGIITDSLPAGSYTIVMLAGDQPLVTEFGTPSGNLNTDVVAHPIIGMGVLPIGQIFYKKLNVQVANTASHTELEVSLNRIVGRLTVQIQDALPASDPNGWIRTDITPAAPTFSVGTGQIQTPDDFWQFNGTRTSQTTFVVYLFGSDREFNVVINYADKVTGESKQKTIQHITCAANTKTVIKGYLYGAPQDPAGQGYQVKVNQSWSSDSTLINF